MNAEKKLIVRIIAIGFSIFITIYLLINLLDNYVSKEYSSNFLFLKISVGITAIYIAAHAAYKKVESNGLKLIIAILAMFSIFFEFPSNSTNLSDQDRTKYIEYLNKENQNKSFQIEVFKIKDKTINSIIKKLKKSSDDFDLGLKEFENGNYENALTYFSKCEKSNKVKKSQILFMKGFSLQQLNHHDEALKLYIESYNTNPNNIVVHIAIIGEYLSKNDIKSAKIFLNKRPINLIKDVNFWTINGSFWLYIGKIIRGNDEKKALRKALFLEVSRIKNKNVKTTSVKYKTHMESFEKALYSFEQIILIDNDYELGYSGKAVSLYYLGKFKESFQLIDLIISSNPLVENKSQLLIIQCKSAKILGMKKENIKYCL